MAFNVGVATEISSKIFQGGFLKNNFHSDKKREMYEDNFLAHLILSLTLLDKDVMISVNVILTSTERMME